MKLRIWLAGLIFGLFGLAAESGAELFQKAVTQERAGKLDEAIKLYGKVAHDFASDRALAAKALVAAARDYEKLGQDKQDQAVKLYEQVTREYGDQREFAETARVKLAALRQPAPPPTMTLRKIETSEGVRNIVGTDGQRAVYWDTAYATLYYGDLAGKTKQVVYKAAPGTRVSAAPTRDLSTVFLGFSLTGPFAVVKTDGTGYLDIPLRFQRATLVNCACPLRWSWDNRYFLRIETQADGSARLQRISVADGKVVEVLQRNNGISWAVYSPDSRFIAFGEGAGLGPVYVVPAQGGEPRIVADNASGGEWTRDGKYLLISADHSGTLAMFAVPMQNGQAAGERVFIRSFDTGGYGGMTPSGALLLVSVPFEGPRILVASLGAEGHLGAWKPLGLVGNPGLPSWSPDGGKIAYISRRGPEVGSVVRIWDATTGADRELYRTSGDIFRCVWANQHPILYCSEISGTRTDIWSVSVDSGHAEKVGFLDGFRDFHVVSVDDRRIHMYRPGATSSWWEIGTNHEIADDAVTVASADGNWQYTWSVVPDANNRRELRIRPGDGGEWKRLTYLKGPASLGASRPYDMTSDGNWIVYRDRDTSGGDGLYRISTSGGEPDRLGDYPSGGGDLAVSSKGQVLVMTAPPPRIQEFWSLENFVPKAPAAR